ncbi:MAG: cytochrome c [Bdellovibrionales bacterium]|nr:cytochrome c [Bdellovibrionales bacterium]
MSIILRARPVALAVIGLGMLSTSPAFGDATIEQGKTVYNTLGACGTCHGPEGKGDGPAGAALNPKPRSFAAGDFALDTDGDGKTGTETDVFNVITNGAQKYGGSVMMVGRPDIPEADRKALAKYVLSLKQ